LKTFGSNKSQIYYDLFQSLSHGTNAKVQGDQAERLPATTSIVEWHTSSRWSPLKMTATKVRMAHQAVPCRQGGQVKGETLCGCRRRGTRGAGQRGNPLWLSPCSGHKGQVKGETLCGCRRVPGTPMYWISVWRSPSV